MSGSGGPPAASISVNPVTRVCGRGLSVTVNVAVVSGSASPPAPASGERPRRQRVGPVRQRAAEDVVAGAAEQQVGGGVRRARHRNRAPQFQPHAARQPRRRQFGAHALLVRLQSREAQRRAVRDGRDVHIRRRPARIDQREPRHHPRHAPRHRERHRRLRQRRGRIAAQPTDRHVVPRPRPRAQATAARRTRWRRCRPRPRAAARRRRGRGSPSPPRPPAAGASGLPRRPSAAFSPAPARLPPSILPSTTVESRCPAPA